MQRMRTSISRAITSQAAASTQNNTTSSAHTSSHPIVCEQVQDDAEDEDFQLSSENQSSSGSDSDDEDFDSDGGGGKAGGKGKKGRKGAATPTPTLAPGSGAGGNAPGGSAASMAAAAAAAGAMGAAGGVAGVVKAPLPPLLSGQGDGLCVYGLTGMERHVFMRTLMAFGIHAEDDGRHDQMYTHFIKALPGKPVGQVREGKWEERSGGRGRVCGGEEDGKGRRAGGGVGGWKRRHDQMYAHFIKALPGKPVGQVSEGWRRKGRERGGGLKGAWEGQGR